MIKWEYTWTTKLCFEEFQKLGERGWELVGIENGSSFSDTVYFFKRPIKMS